MALAGRSSSRPRFVPGADDPPAAQGRWPSSAEGASLGAIVMWPFIHRLCVVPLFVLLGFSSCKIVFFTDGSRVRAVHVTPANPTIAVGTGQQFVASVLFSDGINFQVRLTGVLWSSSNPAIATISSDGLATGHSAGTVIITAPVDGVSGTTNLTVAAPGPPKVHVVGSASKLEVIFPQTGQNFLYVANPFENTISVYWEDLERGREQLVASVTVEPAAGPAWL